MSLQAAPLVAYLRVPQLPHVEGVVELQQQHQAGRAACEFDRKLVCMSYNALSAAMLEVNQMCLSPKFATGEGGS